MVQQSREFQIALPQVVRIDQARAARAHPAMRERLEAERTAELIAKLEGGAKIALVSDAGTPLISEKAPPSGAAGDSTPWNLSPCGMAADRSGVSSLTDCRVKAATCSAMRRMAAPVSASTEKLARPD